MLNFVLLGAGRIGKIHANIIHDHPKANLKYVYDLNKKSSSIISKKYKLSDFN